MFGRKKKKVASNCPKCFYTDHWDGNKCRQCGYVHKLAQKDKISADLIRRLFEPRFYHPHDVFVGSERVPQSAGLYGWYFHKSLVNKVRAIKQPNYLIKAIRPTQTDDEWHLLYIGIAGKKKGRTLQDRIHGEHLNQNTKGSTLRQTLCALLWDTIKLDPRNQLNDLDEKSKLNRWMFDNARVTWLNVEKPEKLEKILLNEFGEYLPFNLQDNKANPYLKDIKRLRKEWRKGG